jgi:hypothetical protein
MELFASHLTLKMKSGILDMNWRKLHNEELHNLCALRQTYIMIQPRIMRWAGHVARIGEMLNGKPEETIRNTKT